MASRSRGADRLGPYRDKRSAARTPEPFGSGSGLFAFPPASGRGRFVVQKHAARRVHYDLRLEHGGVLLSWAVPRGPSLDPAERRLAVEVEPHPLEYGDFEGIIPEGNYGAGAVIVWDRGLWVAVEELGAGLAAGKLLFELRGHKLRGRFTLVRTRKGGAPGKEWLLIKKPDAAAAPAAELGEQSVLSGLLVEQLGDAAGRAAALRSELVAAGARPGRVDARAVPLMLCRVRDEPFAAAGWLFEIKYDGYRLVAATRDGRPYLRYRRGREVSRLFPELGPALTALPAAGLVLDGELVVLDDTGRPSFPLLQQRAQLGRAGDIQRAAVEQPATLFVFDLLACEGFDLRPLPLRRRKELLARLVPALGSVRYCEHIEGRGRDFFRQVTALRLEGMVAKRADAPYRGGRSDSWLKIRVDQVDDFAVVGYSAPRGSRTGLGALHLAVRDGERWRYAGRVGSGLSEQRLVRLRRRLDGAPRREPAALLGAVPPLARGDRHVWVEPALVVTVRYKEWTAGGLLRQPTFLAVRDDITPAMCERPAASAPVLPVLEPESDPEPGPGPPPVAAPALVISNRDKVFWPAEGYTKGDLVEYHRGIADWLLPYLRDRPVVLTRYPDGITGKSFFQKDAPTWVPEWVRTEQMWSEHAARQIHYFVCDHLDALLYLINLGTIPLHVWSSRMATLGQPDWCIVDLDPKGAPFAHVVRCARALRDLCQAIGLPSFVKTSGATGLHVLIPLGQQCTYEQSRGLAELLARVIEIRLPEIATTRRTIQRRGGRVYLDYGQNGHGRLLVSTLSVRPLPGAPVSMPLSWREVTPALDPARFTIRTALSRLRRLRRDPLAGLLELRPDLPSALKRLQEQL
jgi:bifunctional non-homologous end joining protein LigD